ncbi:hypothetical protein L1987_11308 [Smallanthus sonchifolius]|uniref:Uncharacterized protein n=1 Tax=Smallanthus sonchifolius TaxID=185202 RepID=A0ACB9JD00_9ASTR|nr:hypothetical protein L1987_11308 [Smallanthus sonchifolius]
MDTMISNSIHALLYTVQYEFPLNEKIENINDQYWTLRSEEVSEEENDAGPQDRLIHNFEEPFSQGETLAEVKVRI